MGNLTGDQGGLGFSQSSQSVEPKRAASRPGGRNRTRRLLIGLGLFQSALIVFLFVRLSDMRSETREIAQRLAHFEEASRAVRAATAPGGVAAAPAEYDLRRILKDELALALAQHPGAATTAAATAAPARTQAYDAKATEVLRSQIESDFTALVGPGRATPARMASLQEKIAKLPPGERQAALNRLTRAMNDGRIDAHF